VILPKILCLICVLIDMFVGVMKACIWLVRSVELQVTRKLGPRES
jgi:hypothetical protein